jgi:hypothetical protein
MIYFVCVHVRHVFHLAPTEFWMLRTWSMWLFQDQYSKARMWFLHNEPFICIQIFIISSRSSVDDEIDTKFQRGNEVNDTTIRWFIDCLIWKSILMTSIWKKGLKHLIDCRFSTLMFVPRKTFHKGESDFEIQEEMNQTQANNYELNQKFLLFVFLWAYL